MRPSEDALIATYFAPLAGPGGLRLADDAAAIPAPAGADIVISKDILVAGVHFFADDPADLIARKALRVNLSDLAAKAAAPLGFLLGLALPGDWTAEWLAAFAAGLGADAAAFAVPLLGGDTVKTPGPLTVSVTVLGEVPAGCMVPRTGCRAGDVIYVTGTIGDAALGLAVRRGTLTPPAEQAVFLTGRYLLPQPRLALRESLRRYARAAMDVSDGFVGDLAKMLRLAGLTATVEVEAIPLSAAAKALSDAHMETILTGGDDYEILCAVPPNEASLFEVEAAGAGIAVTRVATAREGAEPPFITRSGMALSLTSPSFSHF